MPSISTLSSASGDSLLLQGDQFFRARLCKIEKCQKFVLAEGSSLRRSLNLDDPAGSGHDEIGVRLRSRILQIVQVYHRLAGKDAAGNRRNMILEDLVHLGHGAGFHPFQAVVKGNPAAGNGGRAGAAIGLDDVAVNGDLRSEEHTSE